jgi:hypothetical protein
MNYKKDQILYCLVIEDDGKCYLEKYKVSTVNKRGTYAIFLSSWTWINKAAIGKKFSKNKNMGWASNIPRWCKKFAPKDSKFTTLFTTKLSAWKSESKDLSWLSDDEKVIKRAERNIKMNIKKLSRKIMNEKN